MATIKKLWVEAYRPNTLDGYIFQDPQHEAQVRRMITEGDIPHLLLCGVQGSGKTTLARILIKALEVDDFDLLSINASDKTGIDYIRDTIIGFAESYPLGKFKVIHLEEFDHMSQAAQAMLRDVMESSSDTCRFICTCNYENKIIPAIKSRLQTIRFKAPDQEQVLVRMVEILDSEGVEFDIDALDAYVRQAYPDIRKIINNLQLNTDGKKLRSQKDLGAEADYKFQLLDMLVASDFQAIYETVLKHAAPEEIGDLYEFLWQNLKKIPLLRERKDVYEQAVLVIADAVRAHAVSAFPHITFQAACIKLIMVTG